MKDSPRKSYRQSGLALGFFSRYLAHHPLPPCFGAEILKIEPQLAVKSEKPPNDRLQTVLLSFSLKEDWSFSSLPQPFQIIETDRFQSRAVNTHSCQERFCYHEI